MSFDDVFKIFFVVIAAFIVFVVVNMLAMKWRWAEEERTRAERLAAARRETAEPGPGSTSPDGALHSTFGTSGVGASDVGPAGVAMGAGVYSTMVDTGDCDPGDTGGDCGGGDSGGGDSGGGGWDSGGSWS